MKAVLDVGQFVSATRLDRGHPAQILAAWRAGRFELVTSAAILDDLRRVLFYPHIRKRHRWRAVRGKPPASVSPSAASRRR